MALDLLISDRFANESNASTSSVDDLAREIGFEDLIDEPEERDSD